MTKKSTFYTYRDPLELRDIPIWAEITRHPHLCISQTMVQGLRENYGRTNFDILDTLEKFLTELYPQWCDCPENDIRQYLSLSSSIAKVPQTRLRAALKFNQRELQESLRLMVELGVSPLELQDEKLNEEGMIFRSLYL